MQDLLEAVNHHAAAGGMRINASKTKVMSAFIPGEQRQAVMPFEDVDKVQHLGLTVVANGQSTEEIGSIITLPVPHSLVLHLIFGRGVKRCCVHSFLGGGAFVSTLPLET